MGESGEPVTSELKLSNKGSKMAVDGWWCQELKSSRAGGLGTAELGREVGSAGKVHSFGGRVLPSSSSVQGRATAMQGRRKP